MKKWRQVQSVSKATAGAAFLLLFGGCDEEKEKSEAGSRSKEPPTMQDLEIGEDGIARLKEQKDPFTGGVVHHDSSGRVKFFANYENGKQHGPEVRYHKDGILWKVFDYQHGEKVRHREWYPNGNPKIDAMMKDGVAFGRHLTWGEAGNQRFSGSFLEDLLWDGPILDRGEDGTVLWDAIFERGSFVSGKYPEEAEERLLKSGELKPEDAVYRKGSPGSESEEDPPAKAP